MGPLARCPCDPRGNTLVRTGTVQGQIDPQALAFTDNLVNRAAAAGIKVVALAMWTPCWASSAPASLLAKCRTSTGSKAQAWAPVNPATYGSFVAFLASRYGSKLAAIEVWNEPDQANEDYLAGPEKAKHYAAILRAAYPAIKQADPAMTVLGGSLVGSNGAFLSALYAAGIKGYYDGLRSTSTTWCWRRCATCMKCSWPTATPSRFGSTSLAGVAAGRASASSRNRRA